MFERPGASIYYEVHGPTSGYPLLLLAPGGMNSVASMWGERPGQPGEPMPWIDPRRVLCDQFRVISMDQRNAGRSTAVVGPEDGWHAYAADQLALLDHLGMRSTHVMGGCIGSSYALALCEKAPGRVTAAVLQNPIGLTKDNRNKFLDMFDQWAAALRSGRAEVSEEALSAMRENMFGGDFVFSVSRDFVRACPVPLLVLAGHDEFHPTEVAEEIASLAPRAELVLDWAGPALHDQTERKIRDFLSALTPRPC